jgi:hypothetical protein
MHKVQKMHCCHMDKLTDVLGMRHEDGLENLPKRRLGARTKLPVEKNRPILVSVTDDVVGAKRINKRDLQRRDRKCGPHPSILDGR